MITPYSKTQGGFNVSFQAVPGYDYTVQYSTSLTALNPWTNVPVVAQSLNFIANTGAFGDPAPGDTHKTCKVVFLFGTTQKTNTCADNGTINIGDGNHSITVLNAVYGSTNGLFDVTTKAQNWVVTLGTGNGKVAPVTITDPTSGATRFYRLARRPTPWPELFSWLKRSPSPRPYP